MPEQDFEQFMDGALKNQSGPAATTTAATSPTQTQPASDFEKFVDGSDTAGKLSTSINQGASLNPEEVGKNLSLQHQTGLPPDLVDRNQQDLSTKLNAQQIDPKTFTQTSPKTAEWMAEHPNNAAAAQGDQANLAASEAVFQHHSTMGKMVDDFLNDDRTLFGTKFEAGITKGMSNLLAEIAKFPATYLNLFQSGKPSPTLSGQVTGEEPTGPQPSPYANTAFYKFLHETLGMPHYDVMAHIPDITESGAVPPIPMENSVSRYFEGLANKQTAQEPEAQLSTEKVVQNYLYGDAHTAGLSLLEHFAEAVPNLVSYLTLGRFAGPTAAAGLMGTQSATQSMQETEGKNINPDTRTAAALLHGGIGYALGSLPMGNVEKIQQEIAKAVGPTAARQVWTSFAKGFASTFGMTEAQGALQPLADDFADKATGVNPKAMDHWGKDILQGMASQLPYAVGFGLSHAPLVVAKQSMLKRQIVSQVENGQAQLQREAYLRQGDLAQESKLRNRSPEAHQDLVAKTAGETHQSAYIPVEAWETHFQSAGHDPAQAAKEMGIENYKAQSEENGGYVKVNYPEWLAKTAATDLYAKFADDVKFDPRRLTVNEGKNLDADLQKEAARQTQDQAAQGARKVGEDIYQQLKLAGRGEREAKSAAQLWEKGLATAAQRYGVDPWEYYQSWKPRIMGPEGLAGEAARQAVEKEKPPVIPQNIIPKGDQLASLQKQLEMERMAHEQTRQKLESAQMNPVTGLKGKAQYDEDRENLGWQGHAAYDLDNLGLLNEHLGHTETNKILRVIGLAAKSIEDPNTVRHYHLHGDEFAVMFKDPESADAYMKDFQDRLNNVKIPLVNAKGEKVFLDGIGMSFGTGRNYEEADEAAGFNKTGREKTGERLPSSTPKRTSEGEPTPLPRIQSRVEPVAGEPGLEGPESQGENIQREGTEGSAAGPEGLPGSRGLEGGGSGGLGGTGSGQRERYGPIVPRSSYERIAALAYHANPIYKLKEGGYRLVYPEPSKMFQPNKHKEWELNTRALKDMGVRVTAEKEGPRDLSVGSMAEHLTELARMQEIHYHPVTDELRSEAERGNSPDTEIDTLLDYFQDFRGKSQKEYLATGGTHKLGVYAEMLHEQEQAEGQPTETHFQGGEKPRGFIRFNSGHQLEIGLLKGANKSTFVHETGHFYLKMLEDLAGKEGMPLDIKKDWETALDYLGAKPGEELTEAQHEKWAKSFESYLMEGKAPSSDLRMTFARFRDWLVNIYRHITSLGVQPSLEVKGVFDRLLATDEEIEAARNETDVKPLFSNLKDAGLDERTADRYSRLISEANEQAKTTLTAKVMAQMEREQGAKWAEEKDGLKKDLAKNFDAHPAIQARYAMEKGTLPNGQSLPENLESFKIDEADLKALVGPEGMKGMPKIYSRRGGLSPDAAAGVFGFQSGDQMIKTIRQMPDREEFLDSQAELAMKEKHGDLMTDGKMAEEAQKAVQNDKQAQVLRAELALLMRNNPAVVKGLVKLVTNRVLPDAELRDKARSALSGLQWREISPINYQRAFTRHGKAARDLLLKGDIQGAFDSKNLQLWNHELYKAAQEGRDQAEKNVAFCSKFSKPAVRAKIGKAGESYLDQIDALTDRFEFTKNMSLKAIDRKQSFVDWVNQRKEEGYPLDLSQQMLDEANKKHWKEMTLGELQEVKDTLGSIEHLADLKNQMLANRRFKDFNDLKGVLLKEILGAYGKTQDMDEPELDHLIQTGQWRTLLPSEKFDYAPGAQARFGKIAKGFLAAQVKPEFIMDYLSGSKAAGEWWKSGFDPLNDAQAAEYKANDEWAGKWKDIWSAYSQKERDMFHVKQFIPEIGNSMTLINRIMAACNRGNEYNWGNFLKGEGWTPGQGEAVLKTLSTRDWGVVEKIQKLLDDYWQPSVDLQQRLTGLKPEKITPQEFTVPTADGKTYSSKGAYFPVLFEGERAYRSHQLEEKQAVSDLFGGTFVRPATEQGRLVKRVGTGGRPFSLDINDLIQHFHDTIHDLNFREPVMDLYKLYNDKDLRDAIELSAGKELYRQLNPALKDVARNRRSEPFTAADKVLNSARTLATPAVLGFRATSALVHTSNIGIGIRELGPEYSARGTSDFFRDPVGGWKRVLEKSPFMAHRFEHMDRDLQDSAAKMGLMGGPLAGGHGKVAGAVNVMNAVWDRYSHAFQRAGFLPMQYVDRFTSMPLWMGGYAKAFEGKVEGLKKGSDADAISYADKLVREVKGSGEVKDLSDLQRRGEAMKLFTMFYGPASVQFNNYFKAASQYRASRSLPHLVSAAAAIWFIPAVIGALIRGHVPQEDENKYWWLARQEAMYPLESMVFVRDLAHTVENFSEKGQVDFEGSPVGEMVQTFGKLMLAAKHESEEGELRGSDVRNAVDAASYATGMGLMAPFNMVKNFTDWVTGDWQPNSVPEGIWQSVVSGSHQE